jgi:hypothetical protein
MGRSQGLAAPLTAEAASLIEKETLKNEYRIMNVEGMYSARRELLCRTVYFKKDRAQRFYPSKFCGSIFEILRFAFPEVLQFAFQPLNL